LEAALADLRADSGITIGCRRIPEVSLMAEPLHYRIRPGALAVVVPHPKRS
jgi:hypothetical protein